MKHDEQVDALYTDLTQLLARYRSEFDLHVETMIGCMEFVKNDLLNGAIVEFEVDDDFGFEGLDDE
tara:strand:- start:1136 stop:1333 length:198 start_codon:yes stop_codon:yes gene_type:complete